MQQQSMVGVDYIRQKTDLTESDLDLLEIRDPLDHIKMPGAEARLYNLDAVEYLPTSHKETRTAMHCRLLQWNDQTIQRFDDECKQVMACWQPPSFNLELLHRIKTTSRSLVSNIGTFV